MGSNGYGYVLYKILAAGFLAAFLTDLICRKGGFMKKVKLDTEQCARAIFALISEVSYVSVHGVPYVYFKLVRDADAAVVKSILKYNGIDSEIHKSRYYNMYGSKRLVVRAPRGDFDKNLQFKEIFEALRKDKDVIANEYDLKYSDKAPVCFALWPKSKKINFINMMANRTR